MSSPGKAGPSRAWFILPGILMLTALVLGGFGVSSLVNFVSSDFRPYQPNSSVSVNRDGFTLYAGSGDSEPTILFDLRCTATGSAGSTPLQGVLGRNTLSNGRGTFEAIASTPKDLPAGRYAISCESASGDANIPLFVGPRIDLPGVGRVVVLGVVAPLFLGVCAVVLFGILAFLRYQARRSTSVPAPAPVGPSP